MHISPKSEKRARRLSAFVPIGSRSTASETPQQPATGITSEQLITIPQKYINFLTKKKRAGSGLLTFLESRQEARVKQIESLSEKFEALSDGQTFEKWQEILILLVEYRIIAYTENFIQKSESTYGDALWAVQEHVLNAIAKTAQKQTAVTDSVISKIIEHKNNEALCDKANVDSKIFKAAFGHYTALSKHYPQLAQSNQRVKDFMKEIDSPQADELLQFENMFQN